MDKRYTVFVSSTYNDMKDERNAVIQAIMRAGHIPLGMEAFGAANASSWKVITKTINAADYYVLLIARRYGSINPEVDLGYTEQEFRYAVEQGVPVLVFLLHEDAAWPGTHTDTEAGAVRRLAAFRDRAKKDRQVEFWTSKEDLPFKVMTSLSNAFNDDPRPGWVRPSPIAGPGVAEAMARLTQENAELREKLDGLSRDNEMIRLAKALKSEKIIQNDISSDALTCFVQIKNHITTNTFDRIKIRAHLAPIFGATQREEVDIASPKLIDVLGSLGIIQIEIVGLESKTTATGWNNSHTRTTLTITDEGRRFSRFITLNPEIVQTELG